MSKQKTTSNSIKRKQEKGSAPKGDSSPSHRPEAPKRSLHTPRPGSII